MLPLGKQNSPSVRQRMRGLQPIGTEGREVEEVPDSPSEQGPVEWGPVAAVAASSFGCHAFLVYDLVLVCTIPHLHTAVGFVVAAAGIGGHLVPI